MIPIHLSDAHLLAFGLPGGWEWIAILLIGLLIFGRRLPDVGRSIGRSIVEFKKGIKGIEDELEQESSRPADRPAKLSDQRPAERFEQEKSRNPYASSE